MAATPYRISDYRNQILVIDFWSAKCSVLQNHDAYLKKLIKINVPQNVRLLAIDCNVYEDEGDITSAGGASENESYSCPINGDSKRWNS